MINPDAPLFELSAREIELQAHIDRLNKIKDRNDQALDAMRGQEKGTTSQFRERMHTHADPSTDTVAE